MNLHIYSPYSVINTSSRKLNGPTQSLIEPPSTPDGGLVHAYGLVDPIVEFDRPQRLGVEKNAFTLFSSFHI